MRFGKRWFGASVDVRSECRVGGGGLMVWRGDGPQVPFGTWRRRTRWLGGLAIGLALTSILVLRGWPLGGAAYLVAVVTAMSWNFGGRAVQLWPVVRRRLARHLLRVAMISRRHAASAPGVEFVATFAVVLVVGGGLYGALGGDPTAGHVWSLTASMLMATGVAECAVRGTRLTRHAWTRNAGKLVIAGVSAVALVMANAAARHLAFSVTHEDPKFFPGFVGVMSVLCTPLAYGALLAVILILLSLGELVIYGAAVLLLNLAWILRLVSTRRKERLLGLGPRVPGSTRAVHSGLAFAWRVGSVLALAVGVLMAEHRLLEWPGAALDYPVKLAMVFLDYHPGNTCDRGDPRPGAFLDGSRISIAQSGRNTLTFATLSCPARAAPASPGLR